MNNILSCLALGAILAAAPAWAAERIAPTDPQLQYTGRIDTGNSRGAVLSWPGSAVAGTFTGTSLSIVLDDARGMNYFNVYVDGARQLPVILQLDKGEKSYLVANGLAPGRHTFRLVKRTEGEEGATVFRGLVLDDGAGLAAPPPRPRRRIEFFGDSVTSGMGNEAPDAGSDEHGKDKNIERSYAGIAARQLGAEAHFTSQSGIGVMVSWFPFTMPDFYDQLDAVGDNDSRWDFGRWTPDVVVVNLMQNDSWLIDRERKLQPIPGDAERIAAYGAFIARLRAVYPKAYIVCALGSMDATRPGSPWPGYVTAAVNRLRAAGDRRIDTLFFPFTGYEKHPRVAQHQANADLLSDFVRKRMGW